MDITPDKAVVCYPIEHTRRNLEEVHTIREGESVGRARNEVVDIQRDETAGLAPWICQAIKLPVGYQRLAYNLLIIGYRG